MKFSIREMTDRDVASVVDYFVNADADYLQGMGADKSKLPDRAEWVNWIRQELGKPYDQKEVYYLIWEVDGQAIGHTNINQIQFGQQGNMHLHIWDKTYRQRGIGTALVKQSIPKYFDHFELKKLICEPYAQNRAPVKILEEAGFELVSTYETTPGVICFQQMVNRYEMTREQYELLY